MRIAILTFTLASMISLAGCSATRHTSTTITREKGFATIVVPPEEPFSGRRLLGPEESSINGWLLRFKTPYQSLGPRNYRVPAGTVVFTLKRGRNTKRGIASFGFHAVAERSYELRLDEIGAPKRVTIVERETGRIATPLSTPKRFAR